MSRLMHRLPIRMDTAPRLLALLRPGAELAAPAEPGLKDGALLRQVLVELNNCMMGRPEVSLGFLELYCFLPYTTPGAGSAAETGMDSAAPGAALGTGPAPPSKAPGTGPAPPSKAPGTGAAPPAAGPRATGEVSGELSNVMGLPASPFSRRDRSSLGMLIHRGNSLGGTLGKT